MAAASWPQVLQDINKLVKPVEEISSNTASTRPVPERKARPQEQLNCPRCNSTNTKFCYYNNYSLSQPRYFCKTCRRYWTDGGSLRNVPVGGGSRKNKRSITTTTTTTTTASSSKFPDLNPPSLSQFSTQNPKTHEGQDLNLGFPIQDSSQGTLSHYLEVPKTTNESNQHNSSTSSSCSTSSPLSALELLRTGIASRGLNSFIPTRMPDSNTLYSSSFPLQEFKPSSRFTVDGLGSTYRVEENGGRFVFPFGELKQLSSTTNRNGVDHHHQDKGQGSTSSGFWNNGMLGGGSW